MNIFQSPRLFWILGIVLLMVSVVGAGWALNHSPGSTASAQAPPDKEVPGVHCLGDVDVEGGMANLYPVLPGRVVKVLPEGATVKKGEPVLWLDRRFAELKVGQAKAALEASKAGVTAAKHQLEAVQQDLVQKTRLAKSEIITKEEKLALDAMRDKVEALVKVEEHKLEAAQAQLAEADLALAECELAAPQDGMVLRVFANVGEVLGPNPKLPAIQFCPDKPRIVRAEVLQEWAHRVDEGMKVQIEDDSYHGPKWQGRVKRVSNWFTHKRNIMLEPFMVNDVRSLECQIEIYPSERPLRLGQRVRCIIRPNEGA